MSDKVADQRWWQLSALMKSARPLTLALISAESADHQRSNIADHSAENADQRWWKNLHRCNQRWPLQRAHLPTYRMLVLALPINPNSYLKIDVPAVPLLKPIIIGWVWPGPFVWISTQKAWCQNLDREGPSRWHDSWLWATPTIPISTIYLLFKYLHDRQKIVS